MVYPLLAESADSLNLKCDWRGFIYLRPVVVGVTAPTPPFKAGVPISSTDAERPYIRNLLAELFSQMPHERFCAVKDVARLLLIRKRYMGMSQRISKSVLDEAEMRACLRNPLFRLTSIDAFSDFANFSL